MLAPLSVGPRLLAAPPTAPPVPPRADVRAARTPAGNGLVTPAGALVYRADTTLAPRDRTGQTPWAAAPRCLTGPACRPLLSLATAAVIHRALLFIPLLHHPNLLQPLLVLHCGATSAHCCKDHKKTTKICKLSNTYLSQDAAASGLLFIVCGYIYCIAFERDCTGPPKPSLRVRDWLALSLCTPCEGGHLACRAGAP